MLSISSALLLLLYAAPVQNKEDEYRLTRQLCNSRRPTLHLIIATSTGLNHWNRAKCWASVCPVELFGCLNFPQLSRQLTMTNVLGEVIQRMNSILPCDKDGGGAFGMGAA
jgi:hypothetical protein